jgi:type IV pilus assembly protein PilY1
VRHWEYDINDPIGTGPYTLHVEFNTDDHTSDPDTATVVTCDSTQAGVIDAGGDVDYFEVTVNGEGLITVNTTGSTDTYGQLIQVVDDVEIILTQDNNSGAGNNFEITRTVSSAPVTYYVSVSHNDSLSGTGSYTLEVECATTHTITASADYGGSISPSGSVTVADGSTPSFSITPSGTNTIDRVEVDGSEVAFSGDTYTFPAVSTDHTIVAYFNKAADVCVDISDIPMDARFSAAAANVMFVIDDSGSMDWELMTSEADGCFQAGGYGTQYKYVFPNAGDNLYSNVLASGKRMYWKSQWNGYNRIYYNPNETYDPWPKNGTTMAQADPDTPRSHPMRFSPTFNLDQTYTTITSGDGGGGGSVITLIIDDEDAGFSKSVDGGSGGSLETVIIDDEDPGFSTTDEGVPGAEWDERTGSTQAYNGDYQTTGWRKNRDYTAEWTTTLGAGSWDVIVTWDDGSWSEVRDWVTYKVYDGATLEATVTRDQRSNGGQEVSLGTYDFSGGSVTVRLEFTSEEKSWSWLWWTWVTTACADSVKFKPNSSGGSGSWDFSTEGQVYYNRYWYTPTVESEYAATWTPGITTAGDYEVYVWWDANSTRTQDLTYTVNHGDGTEDTSSVDASYTITHTDAYTTEISGVSQRVNGGDWVYLGTYYFDNAAQNVTFTHTVQNSTDTACAEVAKFVHDSGGATGTGVHTIDIKMSHYYVHNDADSDDTVDDNELWLVVIDGDDDDLKYYKFSDNADKIDTGELIPVYAENVPAAVLTGRTYAEERQNFSNWYSYYRRRFFTAIYSIGTVVDNMAGVNIGFFSFNENLVQPVLPVGVNGVDATETLLDTLYGVFIRASGTPMRKAFDNVGEYFEKEAMHDDNGGIGDSPYRSEAEGGACQQSFAVIMTDGHYNGNAPSTGNADSGITTNPHNDPYDSEFDGSPYGDDYKNTLADIAMNFYERDLVTSLPDQVPTNMDDQASHQHLVTYGVSYGVVGSIDPTAYDFETTFPTWTNPTGGSSDPQKIDDLLHATVNGRGEFFNASNPMELADAMLAIMNNIISRIGSASSVAINGSQLYETLGSDTRMFQAFYNSDGWAGDLRAYNFNITTGEINISTPLWSAAEELDDKDWDTGRFIATHNGTNAVAFRWSNLSTSMQTALGSEAVLNYIRGDQSNEMVNGGTYRNRLHKLGDLVNSSPVYADSVLYVGGNDGMLHAFNASTGVELFAYVPSFVYDDLAELKHPAYSHKFFVDLTPTVRKINDGAKRVLVGGLGKGGKGYFALDVTSPSAITSEADLADKVMWEYPSGTDDDLGFTYSHPVITQTNDSSVGWVAIFGNGYNSVNGGAKLYILDADTGSVIRKIDTGTSGCNGLSSPTAIDVDYDGKADYVFVGDLQGNLWKFDLTDASSTNWDVAYDDSGTPKPVFRAMSPGGTAQPITVKPSAMWACGDHGYLVTFGTGRWLGSFDLEAGRTETIYGIWDYGDDEDDTEYLGQFDSDRTNTTDPLSNQPNGVVLLKQSVEPCTGASCDGNFWLVDDGDGDTQTLRILTDAMTTWLEANDYADPWETSSEGDGGTCGRGDRLVDCDPNGTPSSGANPDPVRLAGWYFDLPLTGERVVSNPIIREGKVIYITFTPEQATPCEAGGSSVIMQMDACSGGRTEDPMFDITDDGMINEEDLIALGSEEVSVTGKQKSGRLQTPAIVIMPDGETEVMIFASSEVDGYFDDSQDEDPTEFSVGATKGLSYWIEFE